MGLVRGEQEAVDVQHLSPPPPPAAGAILFLEPLPIDLHSFHSDSQGDVNVCLFTVHFTAIFILFYQFNLKA